MFKGGVLLRVEMVRDDSRAHFKHHACSWLRSRTVTTVAMVPLGRKQTLSAYPYVYPVGGQLCTCISLSHYTSPLTWLTWVFPPGRPWGNKAESALGPPRAPGDTTWWSLLDSATALLLLSPSTLTCISLSPSLHNFTFTRCLLSALS